MICVDLDRVLFVDALRVAYNMRYIFNREVWIDKTSKGYHVCCDADLPPEVNIKIRETLGDDPWRIMASRKRFFIHRIPTQVDIIFRWKDGREVKSSIYRIPPVGGGRRGGICYLQDNKNWRRKAGSTGKDIKVWSYNRMWNYKEISGRAAGCYRG